MTKPPRRYPIRFSRVNAVFLRVVGMSPRRSYVAVDGDRLQARAGWAFRAEFPRASVVDTRRTAYVWWAYGVHGWRGRWIVNGSGHGVVALRLDPPARARVLGFPVKLRELWVSLDDPDAFLAGTAPRARARPGRPDRPRTPRARP